MKAVLLCAGFGTRLGKLTESCPKPLLDIAGKSIVERQILLLKKHGVTEFYVNLHYLADKIKNALGDGKEFGVEINYLYEEKPTGTAGGVKIFEDKFQEDEDFYVIYGDIVTDENLSRLSEYHNKMNADASLYIHKRLNSNSIIKKESDGKVLEFLERPDDMVKKKYLEDNNLTEFWVNSAIYLLNSSVFKEIPGDRESDFPKDIFPKILEKGKLFALPIEGQRFAIDSEVRLKEANDYYKKETL